MQTDRIRDQLKYLQKHADLLYKIVETGDVKMAGWHAHEVAKSVNAINWICNEMDKPCAEISLGDT